MSFSNNPDEAVKKALEKGYTGVRIEQGVPLLDRDLNLLGDLPNLMLRNLTREFFGNGFARNATPAEDVAFRIKATEPPSNDFIIDGPGFCLVNGQQVHIGNSLKFSEQRSTEGEPDLVLTPPASGASGSRSDWVYLDVWERRAPVDENIDSDLGNSTDVGARTSVRYGIEWRVRVRENSSQPPTSAPAGHTFILLALLGDRASTIDQRVIVDQRPSTLLNDKRLRELDRRVAVLEPLHELKARVENLESRLPRSFTIKNTESAIVNISSDARGISSDARGFIAIGTGHVMEARIDTLVWPIFGLGIFRVNNEIYQIGFPISRPQEPTPTHSTSVSWSNEYVSRFDFYWQPPLSSQKVHLTSTLKASYLDATFKRVALELTTSGSLGILPTISVNINILAL